MAQKKHKWTQNGLNQQKWTYLAYLVPNLESRTHSVDPRTDAKTWPIALSVSHIPGTIFTTHVGA